MRMFVYPMPNRDPVQVFAAVRHMPYSLFLDSARKDHAASEYSYILFQPAETIESKDGLVSIANPDQQASFMAAPLEIVQERIEGWGVGKESRDGLPPFQGGAAGLFGYDLGRGLEKLPSIARDNPRMPDMAVGIYNQLFSYDHKKKQGWHIVHADDEQNARAWHAYLNRLMIENPVAPKMEARDIQWTHEHTAESYASLVERAIKYIYAGDIFQVNLSQRFSADLPEKFDPFAHYCHLREINAAPFAAYMNLGDVKISSASPERFLKTRGHKVETKPIKGTRARAENPDMDQFFRNELHNSEKDRAENAMIVDLLRNDLSKVCEDHSIDVPDLCALESFSGVHHLVSTVTGTLRADRTSAELLAACFPGGSITGCPKIRAMEIIEDMEPDRRGPYCGSIGYIGYNGAMDSSILIRTLVYDGNKVSFNAGGGIVAESIPEKEYQETLDKADMIFQSFTVAEEKKIARNG